MGEDSGLLGVVAAQARAKADNAVDLPASVTILTVQGATRVPLIQCDKQTLVFVITNFVHVPFLLVWFSLQMAGNGSFA